jgi:hypothetical protein
MKSITSKSLITKSLVRTGIIVASLALAGNAFAANDSHVAANALRTVHPAQTRVVHNYQQAAPAPIAQIFQGLFGLPIPIQVTAGAASDTGGYDPTFDSTTYDSSAVDVDNSQSQAAIDASDQAMQQEDQSLQDMDASNAAAEAQNDAANAATQQYLTNNGM